MNLIIGLLYTMLTTLASAPAVVLLEHGCIGWSFSYMCVLVVVYTWVFEYLDILDGFRG